jgi:Right handed beta helix region
LLATLLKSAGCRFLVFIACHIGYRKINKSPEKVAAGCFSVPFILLNRAEGWGYRMEIEPAKTRRRSVRLMKLSPKCAAFVLSALSVFLASEGDSQADSTAGHVIREIPFIITSPGEYELERDFSVDSNEAAITVTHTANVVVDLKRHTLANRATWGIGIVVEASEFVTVKNGTVYGFGYGVKFDAHSRNAMVNKIILANEGIGISTASNNSTIEGCFMSGTGAGSGIALVAGTTGVLAENNQIDGFSHGIQSTAGSNSKYNYNRISGCNVGLYVYSADEYIGNVFTGCSVNVQPAN